MREVPLKDRMWSMMWSEWGVKPVVRFGIQDCTVQQVLVYFGYSSEDLDAGGGGCSGYRLDYLEDYDA